MRKKKELSQKLLEKNAPFNLIGYFRTCGGTKISIEPGDARDGVTMERLQR